MSEEDKPISQRRIYSGVLGALGLFSLVFSGVISAATEAEFITVLAYLLLFYIVIAIPLYIWNKVPESLQDKLQNYGIWALLFAFFILFPSGFFGGQSWSGSGQVNLFPDSAESKNYRLEADIEVKTKLGWKKEYKVNSVTWPNGGNSYFNDCISTGEDTTCSDDEGRNWTVEVVESPSAPSSE